jgi:nickel/cobalt transporter (NiCoT) family protein
MDGFRALFDDRGIALQLKVIALYAILIATNLLAWGWALAAFHGSAVLLGTALLAYGFGLRHAVDADHIAAIDNVTRRRASDRSRSASSLPSAIRAWC